MSHKSLAQQAWDWLDLELDRWRENGLVARFWWRDDDAAATDPALGRLLDLGRRYELPLALAVIPARLEAELPPLLQDASTISVMQHGYAHLSHAAAAQRKLEIGGDVDPGRIQQQLKQGFEILGTNFGDQFVPVLVPPWNRIDAALLPLLGEIGFVGISTMKARRQSLAAPGLLQVNTHLDPIAWRQGGGFMGVYPAVAILIQHLTARRIGYRDRDEPTGILSHHLVQNPATWDFLEQLFTRLAAHPAAGFVAAADIWG